MNQADNAAALAANALVLDECSLRIDHLIAGQATGEVIPELQSAIDDTVAKTNEIRTKLDHIPIP